MRSSVHASTSYAIVSTDSCTHAGTLRYDAHYALLLLPFLLWLDQRVEEKQANTANGQEKGGDIESAADPKVSAQMPVRSDTIVYMLHLSLHIYISSSYLLDY